MVGSGSAPTAGSCASSASSWASRSVSRATVASAESRSARRRRRPASASSLASRAARCASRAARRRSVVAWESAWADAGLVIHSPDGRCQVSPTRVGSRRCAAGRIRAAAQDDHAAAVRQVPFRGHRAPAWRQSLPAVEERIDVSRHGGSSEGERRRVAGARPVGQRALGADGVERSGPAIVAVRGTSRQ